MKLNRKGFTLIELLVTIAVVGLVVGLSVFGIIKLVGDAEGKTSSISIGSVKEAARIYSAEVSSDSWKKNDDSEAFCVTIGELMNKGLLDKNASIGGNYTKEDYVIVKRNKITLAIETEEMVSFDDVDDENNEICTGQRFEDEFVKSPTIDTVVNYTDRIEINFTSGEADSGVKDYACSYGTSSSNIDTEGVIEGNKCILDGLKYNTNYYFLISMSTNSNSVVAANGNSKTANFMNVNFIKNVNEDTLDYEVTLKYSGLNIYDNNGYYYFNSEKEGEAETAVQECNFSGNIFSCSGSTKSIKSNTWYRTRYNNIMITYPESLFETINSFNLKTKICDNSNNCRDSVKSFNIKKYTVTFYSNGAKEIDGTTSYYVKRTCVVDSNQSCVIQSPSIVAPNGNTAYWWSTDKNDNIFTVNFYNRWYIGQTKTITSDMTYYAIYNVNTKKVVNIKYSVNGGKIGKEENDSGTWVSDSNDIVLNNGNSILDRIEYGTALTGNGLLNYNNVDFLYIVKSGYKAVSGKEWICLSDNCKDNTYNQKTNYEASDFCDASESNCTVILGVNWTKKTSTATPSPTLSGEEKCKQACINESYAEKEYCYRNSVCYCCPEGDTPCKTGGGVTACITVPLE